MMRFLVPSDEKQLFLLIEKIENSLPEKAFWLPIKKEAKKHFLDSSWTEFIGEFAEDRLIAASGLFLSPYEWKESAQLVELADKKVAEIGRSMVDPDYRGQNLMLNMNRKLVDRAAQLELEFLLATVYPNNLASKRSLEQLGMRQKAKCQKQGYERLILTMPLEQYQAIC